VDRRQRQGIDGGERLLQGGDGDSRRVAFVAEIERGSQAGACCRRCAIQIAGAAGGSRLSLLKQLGIF
jgi:hypothetical protein